MVIKLHCRWNGFLDGLERFCPILPAYLSGFTPDQQGLMCIIAAKTMVSEQVAHLAAGRRTP